MENTQTNEDKILTGEELFTMDGYEYFKTLMAAPEEKRDFFMQAYFNIVGSTLLI